MSKYLVIGRARYREHPSGETFEATLDPDAERRAVDRGDIQILDPTPTTIKPGSWTLPSGWHLNQQEG